MLFTTSEFNNHDTRRNMKNISDIRKGLKINDGYRKPQNHSLADFTPAAIYLTIEITEQCEGYIQSQQ